MSQNVAIYGKNKILSHFKIQKDAFWKLYAADNATQIIQQNIDNTDIAESLKQFEEVLDILSPDNIYILSTYPVKYDKDDKKKLVRTNVEATQLRFSLADKPKEQPKAAPEKIGSYYEPASLAGHIDLIKANAKLSVEASMYKEQCERLQSKIIELQAEVKELEDTLDEWEEEEEEEEEKISGTPLERTLSKLMEENIPVLIEHIKGNKVKEEFLSDDIDNVKVSGIENKAVPSIDQSIEKLKKLDPNLDYHLFKLVCVAEQMPNTFKMLMNKLNNM